MFCHYCGILGHDLKHCAVHYDVEKKGGHIEYQYGEFLRAMRGRPRVLGSKATGPSFVSEEGTGCEAEKSDVQADQGGSLGKMEAHVLSLGNPRETDKGNAVIQGKGAELLHVDSLDINCHANVTVTKFALKETGPKIQHPNQLDTDFPEVKETGVINNDTGVDHVKPISLEDQIFKIESLTSTPDLIRPSNNKPKGTWTRINRMDFGLSGFTQSIALLGLGMRDTRETQGGVD